MTARRDDRPRCVVCRQRLEPGGDWLARYTNGRPRCVHRHLCFPPSVQPSTPGLARHAA